MDSNSFDDLVRGAFANASRRGALRVGVGALTAATLSAIGLTEDHVEAKKKRKKKKKKKPVVATCPADLPVTCGDGCCPSAYSLCCVDSFGIKADSVAPRAAGESTCNPPSFSCCPVDQGGGSCGGRFPKCCPATSQAPFGSCAESTGVCCTTEQGGFSCSAERPVCCLREPGQVFEGGNCCPAGSTCCQVDADCPGSTCGPDECCVVAPREAGAERASGPVRQGRGERFHMAAR